MNMTSVTCYRPILEISSLTRRQVDVLVKTNSTVGARNVIANMLVKCILIKASQIGNNAFKIILLLRVSVRLFRQNLHTAILCRSKCILMHTYAFIAVFLIYLPMYRIAIIGIDRYLSVKHYVNFKTFWT